MAEDQLAPEGTGPVAGDPVAAGHFTTMQMRGGRVQGRDWHLLRLREGSRVLWGSGPDKGPLRRIIRGAIVRGSGDADATLRVSLRPAAGAGSDDGGTVLQPPFGWPPHSPRDMPAHPLRVEVELLPPRAVPADPVRVRSHVGLRAHPYVKHLALEPQFAARREAQEAGFDDALLVGGDGLLAEGTFWSLALWDGLQVTWPQAPALPGVTWRLLQQALDEARIPQRREPVRLDALERQRAAFAVNSTGIRDIASVDGTIFAGDPAFGARLRALLAAAPWEDF